MAPIHEGHDVYFALAIRFHNVSVVVRATESTRVQLCGRLSVEVAGVQLADRLRGKQVRLLLAYLLLNRSRHVGREELIGTLWPEHAPRSQDASLRTRITSEAARSSVCRRASSTILPSITLITRAACRVASLAPWVTSRIV